MNYKNPGQHPGLILSIWIFSVICVYSGSAHAFEATATINYAPEYTTNTLRTEDDEIAEWIHIPGINIILDHDTNSLQLDADYDYQARIYQKDFWEDENISTGSGSARWMAVPQKWDFFISNVRRESTVRAIQAETQANRQITSTSQIGSSVNFKPRSKDLIRFDYTYADSNTSITETKSTRHNGTATYNAALSASRSLQATTTYSDINYSGPFPDAKFTIATLGFIQTAGRFQVDVKIGHNWYDREGRGKTDDGTYEASIAWQINNDSSLNLNAFRGIVDQSNNLTASGNSGPVNENTGINAAFVETRGELTYNRTFGRTKFTMDASWSEEEYAEDVPLDSDRYSLGMNLSREFTRNTSLSFSVSYEERDFTLRDDQQDELRIEFQFNHKIGRALNFNWGVRYADRQSETQLNYSETIASLELRYTFLGAR